MGERQMKYRVMVKARIIAIANMRAYLRRVDRVGKGGSTSEPEPGGAGTVGCGTVCCCEREYCVVSCTPGVLELRDDGVDHGIIAKPSDKFSSALSIAG